MEWLVLGIFLILLGKFVLGPFFQNLGGFVTGIQSGLREPGEKTCPMCSEIIKSTAKKCKHCGHLL
jgi:hypothetical protein